MTQGNHPASPGAMLLPAGNQSARLPKRTMYVTCHSQIRYDSKTHWLLLGSCLAHLGITLVTKGLLGQLSNPVGAKDPRIPPEQGVPCRLGHWPSTPRSPWPITCASWPSCISAQALQLASAVKGEGGVGSPVVANGRLHAAGDRHRAFAQAGHGHQQPSGIRIAPACSRSRKTNPR